MEVNDKDWRLLNQEKYLQDAVLTKAIFYEQEVGNDHAHCEFCWDKFSERSGDLHEGFTTIDKKIWICDNCFHDFKEKFKWTVANVVN